MEGSQVSVREVEDRIKKEFPNAHHLHIWDICQHQRVATLHLSVPLCTKISELDKTNAAIKSLLSKYGVNHVTIQFESTGSVEC
jgi:cobalt-zinc-cadmium efflux system protein